MMCNKSPIIKSIQRFKFFVLNELKCQLFGESSRNELQLTGDICDIKESGIHDLISKTDDLILIRVRNLKNIMYQLEDCEFLQLKKMIITECDEVEYLVDTSENRIPDSPFLELRSLHLSMLSNLIEVWNGTSRSLCFRWFLNLREIKIRFCHKLKYVFPLSIGRGLIRLRSIEILDCSEMEGIFYRNEVDDNTNGIYLVEELYLYSLPKFVGFLVQRDCTIEEDRVDTNQSSTTIQIVSNGNGGCNNDELMCPARKLQQSVIQQFVPNKQVSGIKEKDKLSRMEMHSAFAPELMNERLIKLKKLKVAFCDALRVIFCFEENHSTSIGVLNSLEELELYALRNLKHIWFNIPQNIIAFRRLRLLVLSECHNSYLLTISMAKLLVQLQKIQISRCEKMEEIIAAEDAKDVDNTVFPRLKALELHHMPSLKIFSSVIHAMEFPSLDFLKVNQCNMMEVFSYGSLDTPMLNKVQIDGSSYSLMGDVNATLIRYTNTQESTNRWKLIFAYARS
ncbi:uncharacterized protein [Euphorbia lathyris]|uniref:uncharacterized protein n=1 Tax=Euphorbia lathyris TaxID=212925 RepID=UPI003313CDC7